jgi:hypothetical protein
MTDSNDVGSLLLHQSPGMTSGILDMTERSDDGVLLLLPVCDDDFPDNFYESFFDNDGA